MNSQIQRQVECPICMDQFTTPKVLPCQHTFCLQCLDGHHRSNSRGNIISCPECRAQHPLPLDGISGFPTNITIQRLLEAIPAPNVTQQQPTAPPVQLTATSLQPLRNDYHTAVTFQSRFNALGILNSGFQRDRMITSEYENVQHGSNPSELDIARVASLIDNQRELERNVRSNRNQRPERTNRRTIEESQRNVNYRQNEVQTNNRNTLPDNHSNRCTITYVRSTYRKYLEKLFHKRKAFMLFLKWHVLLMTFSRFIAGAVNLASDCEDEYKVAVYLFVKSWFEVFLYSALFWFLYKELTEKALNNVFVQIWLLIQTIFFVIWLIVGNSWIFGNYKEMRDICPMYVEDWNFLFVNFAIFLTVVDWIIAVIFLIYSLYVIFEIYEEKGTSNSEESV